MRTRTASGNITVKVVSLVSSGLDRSLRQPMRLRRAQRWMRSLARSQREGGWGQFDVSRPHFWKSVACIVRGDSKVVVQTISPDYELANRKHFSPKPARVGKIIRFLANRVSMSKPRCGNNRKGEGLSHTMCRDRGRAIVPEESMQAAVQTLEGKAAR